MDRYAYLIAAHDDPKQLNRLIHSLSDHNRNDFYIHIDAKANIELFREVLDKPNVYVCPTRIFTQWGGFSQCRYQKALIDLCLESNIRYSRIFFLSGHCYPLYSNKKIRNFLDGNPDTQFIKGMNITNCDNPPKIKDKLVLYHFFRDLKVSSGRVKRLFSGCSRLLFKFLPFRKKPYAVIEGRKCEIYQGSSWWCVTLDCLKEIACGLNDKNWISYFKYSFAPDEMFIQTIVFNSKFKNNAILHEGDYPGLVGLTPLHYLQYNGAISTYDLTDIETLYESGKMFFRKAVSGKSDSLLDEIDKRRKEDEQNA